MDVGVVRGIGVLFTNTHARGAWFSHYQQWVQDCILLVEGM